MTQFDFTYKLSRLKQYGFMQQYWVKLAERNDGINRFFLFQLDSFYVEGKFHIELSAIQDIRIFSADELPEIYLNEIDIGRLL